MDEVNVSDLQHFPLSTEPPSKQLMEELSVWNQKERSTAPLLESQTDVILDLTSHVSSRPLPTLLPTEDAFSSPESYVDSESVTIESLFESLSLGQQQIDNSHQFLLWYKQAEEQIKKQKDSEIIEYLEYVKGCKSECECVLKEVGTSLSCLDKLSEEYVFVSTKTNALHEACEELLADQMKLSNTAENINNRLQYFNELQKISQKLNAPSLTVNSENFVPMLSRLDECIAYMSSNVQYKESGVYLARYKHCLSKALGYIKSHVVNILQQATKQVQPKASTEEEPLSDDAFTLFYGKFRMNAPKVKALMEQIEQRVEISSEYEQLLSDCHQCYFNQRDVLVTPSVSLAISELAKKHHKDSCTLVRSGFAFISHVCQDEYQLFFLFFSKPTPFLIQFLERLCNSLYDVLRPLIIHVNHLETLAELCSILKVEMLEEQAQNRPEELSAFHAVSSQMLEDVQERLVYRSHIYINTDILQYKPAPGDLAYPDKLLMMQDIAEGLRSPTSAPVNLKRSDSQTSVASSTSQEVAMINSPPPGTAQGDNNLTNGANAVTHTGLTPMTHGGLSPADLHGMWYPTVRRTLVCLSKLYRCLDRETFQGLAQDVLLNATQSLVQASSLIRHRKTKLDGQLFLIKHLLILREQIVPFHLDNNGIKEKALDFSKMKTAAYGLLHKKSRLFSLNSNNALLEFIIQGVPEVMDVFVDSKKDVDKELKKVCEEFIHDSTQMCVGEMASFTKKCLAFEAMCLESGVRGSLKQQPFAEPKQVKEVTGPAYKILKTKVPQLLASMSLYLANRDTEQILYRPIKANVLTSYQNLDQLLGKHYNSEDLQIIACPPLDQVNLLLSSVLATSVRPALVEREKQPQHNTPQQQQPQPQEQSLPPQHQQQQEEEEQQQPVQQQPVQQQLVQQQQQEEQLQRDLQHSVVPREEDAAKSVVFPSVPLEGEIGDVV